MTELAHVLNVLVFSWFLFTTPRNSPYFLVSSVTYLIGGLIIFYLVSVEGIFIEREFSVI